MPPKKINLNEWDKVDSVDDLEGYQGIIIIPRKLIDGTQLQEMFFRKGEPKHNEIEDVTTATWFRDVHISKKGSEIEYARRVDWWFDEAAKDEEYRAIINDSFNKHGFDVKMSWEKAKNWLKGQLPSSRKTYLHKFIWKWMVSGVNRYLTFKTKTTGYK